MSFLPRLVLFLSCVLTLSAAGSPFRFYDLKAVFFTPQEIAGFPSDGKTDLTALLRKRGLDLPEGSVASYDAAQERLYLKAAERDLNLMDRLIDAAGPPSSTGPYGVKQVRITSVCHAIPLSAVPATFNATSSIKDLEAKSVKTIDRRSLVMRSGQRAKSGNHTPSPTPAKDDGETPPPKDQRELEVEVTVGEDGDTMDLNFGLTLRTPDLAPAGDTAEFTLTSQALMHNGGTMLHELGVTSESQPRLVIWEISVALEPASVPAK